MRAIPAGHAVELDVLVTDAMTVRFDELGPLHPVYATYEIARHFEEAGRKLLLPFLEDGEEGIGSALYVEHRASALPGMHVRVTATAGRVEGRRLFVVVQAMSELGDLIATGSTTQYVTSAERLHGGFRTLQARWLASRSQREENT